MEYRNWCKVDIKQNKNIHLKDNIFGKIKNNSVYFLYNPVQQILRPIEKVLLQPNYKQSFLKNYFSNPIKLLTIFHIIFSEEQYNDYNIMIFYKGCVFKKYQRITYTKIDDIRVPIDDYKLIN